ncbi:uncharacterized protein LOC144180648 [Haemaphysalis longicornis]
MVRSIALGPSAGEEKACCNSCGAHTEAGGPSLDGDQSRLVARDTLSLEHLHRGVSAEPTLSPLPDLVTSCVAEESVVRPSDSSAACPWGTCRHRAKVVGRRLRFLADSLDKRRLLKRPGTKDVILHDWLTDLMTACLSSVLDWWQSSA